MAKLDNTYNFTTALKVLPTEGNLVYEYNPFRNYRLDEDMIYYKNRLWTYKEFCKDILDVKDEDVKKSLNIENRDLTSDDWKKYISTNYKNWPNNKIPKTETPPIVYLKGQLVDFETDELDFDLNHPVNITPLWSYDNSVNLIINDGKNPPRIINSRFSITERNKYQICDRKGNNDTNIYDLGSLFNVDTSLYKKTTTIPKLEFLGVLYGGNLSIGNYHFYFRYVDDDGNESDFFAESGLVSLFIGSTPDSIRSGFREENSHKMVKFFLTNTDVSYLKIVVYYTRATSDIFQNAAVTARKIDLVFLINQSSNTLITITGFENTIEVPLTDINPTYLIYGSAETQAVALNMLFLGNVDKPKIPYEDLADCALRFLPFLETETYNFNVDIEYNGTAHNNYYDPSFIYNKVGYWDDEIYRFGIVFILSDNTLTPVFNVRGIEDLPDKNSFLNEYLDIKFYSDSKEEDRYYISYNEETFEIREEGNKTSNKYLENSKGVISLNKPDSNKILGINFAVPEKVINYLLTKLGIQGYFFVRLKRIPTTLCQAYTIAIDSLSNTPVLPIKANIQGYSSSANKDLESSKYITESFLSQIKLNNKLLKTLTHEFKERILSLSDLEIRKQAAICPEYDVNSPYLNSLFTGGDFVVRGSNEQFLDSNDDRHFIIDPKTNWEKDNSYHTARIIGVEDNTKLVAISDDMFSARAGEAEEAFRYEYAGRKNKTTDGVNLLRGSYGPFLGITGYEKVGLLIDIKIPGYSKTNLSSYFKIRYADKSSYYAISDRIDLSRSSDWYDNWEVSSEDESKENEKYKILVKPLYRGDCYICQFTHRVNRNFQDPSAPTNNNIVDEKCWRDNFEVSDGVVKKENFEKINLGDVNAVGLGMWVTFTLRSTMNLNIRALDESIPDESALTGHPRGFYPYLPRSISGVYKVPEALCYNKGFEKSTSEKWNFEVPDVPWIKNEFSNRICYSDIQVVDSFRNGFRVFKGTNYRDYPKTYGSITKLVELGGNLLCIFEHGIGLIPVNERALAGEGAGGNIYINTSNVLPQNPKIISDTFGSLWRESIVKTDTAVYGVDTVGKKIWRTNGNDFECISDFKVLEFLNNNISLTERELLPIIGVRNVKSHYNKFKGDVMFTFYDNLYGFEEKVWNLCWNENLQKWITFYSWVPSYSENIYNQYFSFDRNTSKYIAKLGVSKHDNAFSDGITLSENIISDKSWKALLYLDNRTLPTGKDIKCDVKYEIVRDNYGNYKLFNDPIKTDAIDEKTGLPIWEISLKDGVTYEELCSEYYVRGLKDAEGKYTNKLTFKTEVRYYPENSGKTPTYSFKDGTYWTDDENPYNSHNRGGWRLEGDTLVVLPDYDTWICNCVQESNYSIYKDDKGKRVNLSTKDKDRRVNGDRLVIFLNIKANIIVNYTGQNQTLGEAYKLNFEKGTSVDAGYYQSTVAIIPKYNMLFLTTDFWKHGQSGIIDIADQIYPTYWYGKQHPFEFEFVVADNPDKHKIFDNLLIISNKAAPESFHYEIVGECYDFAKDKENMYIRLEATKELYQYNGSNIVFNPDYKDLISEHRPLTPGDPDPLFYDKSTLFPLYYGRRDTINEIEDFYHLYGHKDDYGPGDSNFSALSGSEIVFYKNLNEYRIWTHAKAVDVNDFGLLRGNMRYKEDKWNVQINAINLVLKNETKSDWSRNGSTAPPIVYNLFPFPKDISDRESIDVPASLEKFNTTKWNDIETDNKLVKLKDKFIKIRIRYSGEDLSIISAIKTLYSISYA